MRIYEKKSIHKEENINKKKAISKLQHCKRMVKKFRRFTSCAWIMKHKTT